MRSTDRLQLGLFYYAPARTNNVHIGNDAVAQSLERDTLLVAAAGSAGSAGSAASAYPPRAPVPGESEAHAERRAHRHAGPKEAPVASRDASHLPAANGATQQHARGQRALSL